MIPLQIVSRDFTVTDSIQFEVEKHVQRLEKLYDRILGADVAISLPHKHAHKGRIFHLAIKIRVPGETLIVNREPEMNSDHEDFHLAVRDAFGAMRRKLSEFGKRQNHRARAQSA